MLPPLDCLRNRHHYSSCRQQVSPTFVSINDQPSLAGNRTPFKHIPFSADNQPSAATHFSPASLLSITSPRASLILTFAHHSHHSFVPTGPTNFSKPATSYHLEVESGESSTHHKGKSISGISPDTKGQNGVSQP